MNDMLIIEDVSYRYKVREDATLKHVCLHVAKGEMLLLAGRSGCGKSTLIKAVSATGAGTEEIFSERTLTIQRQKGDNMAKADSVTHTFEPIFNNESKVLILGTFPSVKSREQQFYYGHPQNRFWKLLALLMEDEIPDTIPKKKDFLLRHRIAVWDVIHSCTIEGSSDSSIRDVVPNDISMIIEKTQIETIFTNGGKAHSLYEKYVYPVCGIHAVKLPSTSPANAAFSLERLEAAWQAVRERL